MDFQIKKRSVAGSVDAILADESVRAVYSAFGDGMMSCFGMDIRNIRSIHCAKTLRQVQSFTKEYGDDAVDIVNRIYGKHHGMCQNRPVGANLFSQGKRWFVNDVLAEVYLERKLEADW